MFRYGTHLFCFVGVAAIQSTSLPYLSEKGVLFFVADYEKAYEFLQKSIKKWTENDVSEGLFFAINDRKAIT